MSFLQEYVIMKTVERDGYGIQSFFIEELTSEGIYSIGHAVLLRVRILWAEKHVCRNKEKNWKEKERLRVSWRRPDWKEVLR